MRVYDDFVTETDELNLFTELEPTLRKLRYESAHWDNVSNVISPINTVSVLCLR